MCGIVGIVRTDGASVTEAELRGMCDAIHHRGPDEDGLYTDGPVGLGMRRLSIIDLAGSRQPLTNEDDTVALMFNGEIYNYRDLRQGLLSRGHTLRTQGDTETIVHLYEEVGERCPEQLRGMFGFALWDRKRRRLLLARDRFGIKPLYVAEGPWGLAFASELKALHAAGYTKGDLDWEALDAYFQLGYIPAPYTPFRHVRKLRPGYTLSYENGVAAERRYWDLPSHLEDAPDDVEARVREWLDDSVKAHLESDVPVAAFLSGGLDSSAIVSSMAIANGTPHAFSVRFTGPLGASSDETGLARLLADRYGAKLTVVDVRPDVRDIFDRIVYTLDEPLADESAMPSWLLAEVVAKEYKVALAGTGGDELFAGYRRHIGLLLGETYRSLPRVVQKSAAMLADAVPEPRAALTVSRVKRFLRATTAAAPERYVEILTRLGDDLRGSLYADRLQHRPRGDSARELFARLYAEGGAPRGLRAGLYLDYKTYLPEDILAVSDRTSMAHSLEVRVPFVDHRLVENVFPLPDRVKVGARLQAKRLLRRALEPRLPEAHFRAPKRGFVGPVAGWLRGELKTVITDELSPARLTRLGYFNPATVQRLVDEHMSQKQNRSGILWNLLCFSTWHRLFLEGQ